MDEGGDPEGTPLKQGKNDYYEGEARTIASIGRAEQQKRGREKR